jgi:hypothetical protein
MVASVAVAATRQRATVTGLVLPPKFAELDWS